MMNEREKIINNQKSLQLKIKSLNEEYKINIKLLESKINISNNEICDYEKLLHTAT